MSDNLCFNVTNPQCLWLIIGFTGQFVFALRFFIQWLESEKAKKSIIPLSFWYFSVLGSIILLAYAIHRKDPVFIVGQSLGSFIYIRNIILRTKNE